MQAEMLDSIVSNSMQLFADKGFKIRVIMRLGDPWFVAKDACDCLAIADVSQACKNLDDDEKQVVARSPELSLLFRESSNAPTMTLISESGLYTLVMRSNKPEAKVFRKWVTSEVLPSIRMTGGYGIRTVDDMINDPDTAIRLLTQLKILRLQNDQLEMERDEAIRTKAMIGSRREATAMNTASQKSKECEKLREQIGDSKTYKAVTAITWLPDYFNMSNRGLYGSLAANLKKIEASMTSEFKHIDIPDSRFGKVKAYHVDVIERLHEMVQADENLMAKYRKITSV